MSEEPDAKFETLLDYLKRNRGFDFTAYKRSTLQRRIEKRMQTIGVTDFVDYVDYLEVHPSEFTLLFNVILINVTEFFRDPPAWQFVAAEVIPRIVGTKDSGEPIRAWSAGCASGEEAYSVAMLFAEALGIEQLRSRVKVYATDVDEDALNAARQGIYSDKAFENVPGPLVEKYFDQEGDRYNFHKEARRAVIFGRHDLIQDPPISRVDLLLCRNTLMYFNNESQAKILARFHFALNNGGFLFAGRAEMLLTHGNIFAPLDLKRRVFIKVPKDALTDRVAMLAQANHVNAGNAEGSERNIFDLAFSGGVDAQVILDAKANLLLANERARTVFRLGIRDEGRPIRDVAIWPPEVHRGIDQVFSDQVAAKLKDMDWPDAAGEQRHYEVTINPLRDNASALIGISVVFQDVSTYRGVYDQLQRSRQELETVSEELQSSNEELETTNEELQSTVEELETTNEELQSTNEELETMNEELQSTNEELHAINDELRTRGEELNASNSLLESILGSMQRGLVAVDVEGRIVAWNHAAEDLWGLRQDEVRGKSLLTLDIGLPVDQLAQPLRKCLSGEECRVTVKAVNRRGKAIACAIECTPLKTSRDDVNGALIVMDQVPDEAAS